MMKRSARLAASKVDEVQATEEKGSKRKKRKRSSKKEEEELENVDKKVAFGEPEVFDLPRVPSSEVVVKISEKKLAFCEAEVSDLSTVPSSELVANMNTLKGGMSCFKQLMDSPAALDGDENSRTSICSQEDQFEDSIEAAREAVLSQGQAQFNELVKRLEITKVKSDPEALGDEFHDENAYDLKTTGQLMRSVFSDYDEKTRLYDLHCSNVISVKSKKLKRHFKKIKDDIREIFEGKVDCLRLQLFVTRNPTDRTSLEKLYVADPFSNMQSMEISEELQEFLFPNPRRFNQENFVDFIRLVLLPEALVRIYSRINKTSYAQSEKEMKWGPRYDGPIDTSSG